MSSMKYKVVSGERNNTDNISTWKLIGYIGILSLICVVSFLIAKYVVRNNIGDEEIPIDTSERL